MSDNITDDLRKCCAFTGHRPAKFPWKYTETDERCIALKEILAKQIEKMVGSGITEFFSGMAQGVDVWAALDVLALRKKYPEVKLHCVLPCEGQEDVWTIPAQTQYRAILMEADSVEYVSRKYHSKCMLDRNRRLIDSAAFLIAVYNGEKRGGTAATVRYAQKMNREIVYIHPLSGQIHKEKSAKEIPAESSFSI